MLKVSSSPPRAGIKRSFEHALCASPLSPTLSPFQCAQERPVKRMKVDENMRIRAPPQQPQELDLSQLSSDERKLVTWMPKAKRAKYLTRGRQAPIFTGEDLHVILTAALNDARAQMQAEYETALQERLKEQYSSFAAYAQDSLHRDWGQNSRAQDYIA